MSVIKGLPINPAKVLAYIGSMYPGGLPLDSSHHNIPHHNAGAVRGLLTLLDHLDPAILAETFAPADEILWYRAVAAIQHKLKQWEAGDQGRLESFLELREHPVVMIHRLLRRCPDTATPKAIVRLTFVQDGGLRDSIGRDMDTLQNLLQLGEWKAATVLGGSIIEALLLDALLQHEQQVLAAHPQVFSAWTGRKPDQNDLRSWALAAFIQAALYMKIIDKREQEACDVVRDYRNLIHAGKELRLQAPCDRGTTYVAAGAVDLVVTKLGG